MRTLRIPALVVGAVLCLGTLVACGGGGSSDATSADPTDTSNAEGGTSIQVAGADALTWGEGPYGVVLAHGAAFDAASWAPQAPKIADLGTTVIAVDDISPESIQAAVEQLQSDGISDVALVGGSAGSDAILDLASRLPDLPDQLVLLSPNGVVEGLGDEPKLFIASQDEPVAEVSTELADSAPGDDNKAMILPGSAHAQNIFDSDQGEVALSAVLARIQEFATA